MNLVDLGFRSTHYYALDLKAGKLLIDCGWPGRMAEFLTVFRRKGVDPKSIRYLLVTHFHMDHAGLVQEFKNLGATLLLMPTQVGYPEKLADFLRPKKENFLEIQESGSLRLEFSASRAFLASLGLAGEIIPTPAHSPDHVTLVLDNGWAFTGDLPPRELATPEQPELQASWNSIFAHPITRIYPAHGNPTEEKP
jgi:glyoxylase-like metal-dependent hydrolase (beta-lactamase superfamily II)